jgi:hypothetical protein
MGYPEFLAIMQEQERRTLRPSAWRDQSLFRSRVIIDVGAHVGGAFKTFAHDGWQVHAFEPDRRNRAVLERDWGNRANSESTPLRSRTRTR